MKRLVPPALVGLTIIAALAATPAFANMAACSSAAVKESLDDQIRLYSLCLEDGLSREQRAGALHNRGVAYMRKGDVDNALSDLSRSLEYDDGFGMGYFNRAMIYMQRGQLDLALADMDRAIELPPARIRTDAYFQRGALKAMTGDYAGALADFNEVVDRDDDRLDALFSSVMLLASAPDAAVRDGAKAIAMAQTLIDENDNPMSRMALAAAYAESSRFDDAVREHRLAMEMQHQAGLPADQQMSEQLALYEASQPYRAPAAPAPALNAGR
jgi:tetratricopeptide (TPR) repeat protein